jgi:EthD domain
MLKVLAFLSKREGMETRAFIDHYENRHVPLVLSLAWAPIVYKRNYLTRGDELNREEDTVDFDVITEMVFSDRADFLAWRGKLSVEAIGADEERFLDRSRTRSYIIEEHVTSGWEREPPAETLTDDRHSEDR